MTRRSLGQSSMEFLGYVAFSSLVLAVLHGVMIDRQAAAIDYQVEQNADKVIEKVSFEVEMALVQGDGYSRVFTLPDGIAGRDYQVRLFNRTAVLEYGDERIIRTSRYSSEEIALDTSETNVFRVVNDGGEIQLKEE